MERIMEIKSQFDEVSFTHIYREFNHKAEKLLKEALTVQGHLSKNPKVASLWQLFLKLFFDNV